MQDQPAYRYGGDGRFHPANHAAHEEVRQWNEYAERVMRAAGTLPADWGKGVEVGSRGR
jgi:hypothetical protein